MEVHVLRLGHRVARDKRISTHCGLVARAFGASRIIYSGEKDEHLIKSIEHVVEEWGGRFSVDYERKWKGVVMAYKKKGWIVVHLTMYGLLLNDVMDKIKKKGMKNMLVVIGGEKVPGEMYELADYNVAIGSQPHSEVAALAVFLHELFEGKELDMEFENARIKVIPSKKGKHTIKSERAGDDAE